VPEFSRQEMVLLSRVEIIPTLRVEQNTVCVCVGGGGWKRQNSVTQQLTVITFAKLSLLFQTEHSRPYGI